jgi:aspartate/glutamate racemase
MNIKDTVLPENVKNNIRFLQSKKVWYILSKNTKVLGCGEAAANRHRLGNKGIPIFDELKSELGFFINKEHKKQKVLVHCRGNQKLDRLKISGVLNSEYQRITNVDEKKGLINPFDKRFRNLIQIFDISTTKNFHPPYTMMTNAGDFEYALEFDVNSLIGSLKGARVDDIIRIDNYNNYIRHKIGILTGNGPDSGILLWRKINESIKLELEYRRAHSFKGDLSYPEIIVSSVPDMGISMELDKRLKTTENTVIKSVINMCQNGVTLMCIACNTTQYYKNKIEGICNLYNIRFVSIPEVINSYLKENQIHEFDFIGISHVVNFEKLSAFKDLNDKYIISKPDTATLEKIDNIAYTAKNNIGQARNYLIDLIKNNTRHNTIIVALTEISTILSTYKDLVKNKIVVDSLQLLADYIAQIYVGGIFETLYVNKSKDSIKIELLNEEEKKKVKNELWNILCEINYEFVPPLSSRNSTVATFSTKTITNVIDIDEPKAYFNTLFKQEIIVSRKKTDNRVTGFMSFIPDYNLCIMNKNVLCHYISTVGVTKGERGNGIADQFYKEIEKIAKEQKVKTIATRTWNSNKTHLKILSSLGYRPYIIKNDRGVGIDTVYLVKYILDNEG